MKYNSHVCWRYGYFIKMNIPFCMDAFVDDLLAATDEVPDDFFTFADLI